MYTLSGTVLGPMEIVNEYRAVKIFKNDLPKGEEVWMHYNKHGTLQSVEAKQSVHLGNILDTTISSHISEK